nr:MAG TPA: hypothetical protein [Caudoviricetes sp.]
MSLEAFFSLLSLLLVCINSYLIFKNINSLIDNFFIFLVK